jgi:hypothetical protein
VSGLRRVLSDIPEPSVNLRWLCSALVTSASSAREAILGSWKLIAYEDRLSEASPWSRQFGDHPHGVGIYAPNGLLSMQVLADPESPSEEPYVGYVGTFAVWTEEREGDGFSGVLEHRMSAASHPELLSEDPARPFNVNAESLVLGDGRTWRRTFQRLLWRHRLTRES